MLYVFLGLFFSISIYAVNAAWNSSVASNQALTSVLWNDLKDRVVLLNSYWSLSGSTLSTPYTVYAPAYTGPGCDDYDKCKGAIIGRALQKLDSGEGVIEVLIRTGL